MTFEEMRAARAWGKTPREWYEEPRWSRAAMVAQVKYESRVDYWTVEDSK